MTQRILPTSISQRGIDHQAVIAALLSWVIAASPSAVAQTYTILHDFGARPDGREPHALLAEGSDGMLYGTTRLGGSGGGAFGTIYKINKDGTGFAILHSFLGSPSDGSSPVSAVLFGSDGALYGAASAGGGSGNGVVYRLTLN
jgi:uncharacterized repeat protein (TIGR03803 family)